MKPYWKLVLCVFAAIAVGLGMVMVLSRPVAYPAYGLMFAGLIVLSALAGEATISECRRTNNREKR